MRRISVVTLINYTMKRTITTLKSGKKADGSPWYMVVFAPELIEGVLYKEDRMFVPQAIYDVLQVGQSLVVK